MRNPVPTKTIGGFFELHEPDGATDGASAGEVTAERP
jgi:hypothetical protein